MKGCATFKIAKLQVEIKKHIKVLERLKDWRNHEEEEEGEVDTALDFAIENLKYLNRHEEDQMRKHKSQVVIAVIFCVAFLAGVWTCSILLDKQISKYEKSIEQLKNQRENGLTLNR